MCRSRSDGVSNGPRGDEGGPTLCGSLCGYADAPGWDGVETIEHLWQEDPDLQVVICTAFSDHAWEDVIQRLNKNDKLLILRKPFDNIEVWQLANSLTKRWAEARQAKSQLDLLAKWAEERAEETVKAN